MGKSYKEELADFKQRKLDPDNSHRIQIKTKKEKPYKVTGTLPFFNKDFSLGKYATPEDAKKAIAAFTRSGIYKDIKCEPSID